MASSGFTRITDVIGNTSTPSGTNTFGQLPSDKAQTFQNQQLPGLSTGTGSQVGQQNSADTSTAAKLVTMGNGDTASPLSVSVQGRQDAVKTANDQLQQLADAKRQRDQAQASASGGYSDYGNGTPQGQAYTPNGALSASRNRVLATASSYLGNPYVLGGTSHRGIDCSGLVMMVYDQLGYGKYLDSHNARIQGQSIPGVRTSINNLRPGDLVAWKDGSHIAIYAGNGQIIEAANERVGTVKRALWASPSQVFGIALRLPGE